MEAAQSAGLSTQISKGFMAGAAVGNRLVVRNFEEWQVFGNFSPSLETELSKMCWRLFKEPHVKNIIRLDTWTYHVVDKLVKYHAAINHMANVSIDQTQYVASHLGRNGRL
jgi:hypothetical protein